MLDKELLEVLACPVCKVSVELDGDWLVCSECARRYPVRDGIPVMLVEEAVSPDSEEAVSPDSEGAVSPDSEGAVTPDGGEEERPAPSP